MAVQLNHTIVYCRDQQASAAFMSEVFGLPEAPRFGPFLVVEMANGVSLDYMDVGIDIPTQHYAFLVSEDDFDAIFGRVQQRGLQ
ncbi:MAG TPA: VOC family protein, partial [Acidimicrobiales bacterium]|nr:VOC family protein [Acidimicrobiales bacterium]